MAKATRHANMPVVRDGLKAFIHSRGKKFIFEALIKIADELAEEIRLGKFDIPVFTGNLRNSTGVAVYGDGRLQYYSPINSETYPVNKWANPPNTQSASGQQTGGEPIYGILGHLYLMQAIAEDLAIQMIDGYYLVIFAAVPYAWAINEYGSKRGSGMHFYEAMMGWGGLGEKLRRHIFSKSSSKTLNITNIVTR